MIVQPLGELALGMPRANGGSGSDVINWIQPQARSGGSTWQPDQAASQRGSDRILGGPGLDEIEGGKGPDRLHGRADPDRGCPSAAATPWCDAPRLVTRGSCTRQLEPDHRYEPPR